MSQLVWEHLLSLPTIYVNFKRAEPGISSEFEGFPDDSELVASLVLRSIPFRTSWVIMNFLAGSNVLPPSRIPNVLNILFYVCVHMCLLVCIYTTCMQRSWGGASNPLWSEITGSCIMHKVGAGGVKSGVVQEQYVLLTIEPYIQSQHTGYFFLFGWKLIFSHIIHSNYGFSSL